MIIVELLTGISVVGGGLAGYLKLQATVRTLVESSKHGEDAHEELVAALSEIRSGVARNGLAAATIVERVAGLDRRVGRLEEKADQE